ncbi:MAG: hypothetical protein LiPW30_772 [Parcubacteria group bacterium LiPW_30]|nr:MAG: hypothetical protein LiPW30_772 [Parcubacteria group bacterium LiPW_30]
MGKKKSRNKNKQQVKFSPTQTGKFSNLLPEPEDFPLGLLGLSESLATASGGALHFMSYNITDEPMDWGYPAELKHDLAKLIDQIRTKPQEAIPKLLVLKDKYPDIPSIYNHIAFAYQGIGDKKNAEFWTRENYRIHPNYLFARINLGQLCLSDNQLDEFEKVFDHKLELKLLYPNRETFHISEVVGFYTLMLDFYLCKQQLQQAQAIYKLLKSLVPDHPILARAKPVLQAALLLLSTQHILAKGGQDFLGTVPWIGEDHKK